MRQPRWLLDYALPSPPDVFGIDGVLLGRAAGFLLLLAGTVVTVRAIRTLGDQLNGIGIRENPRLVDTGPYAYVRHPLYTGNLIVGTSSILMFWSYIPVYVLPINIAGHLLKIPIEERTILEDPVLGKEYERYRSRVQYKFLPYIW